MPPHGLLLRNGNVRVRIRQEFLDGKRRLMITVGIKGQEQRRRFDDDSETDMLSAMNMPFMPFGPSNPAL